MFKLVRFDGLMFWRLLRSQFSRRSDLVLVFIGLPILILAAIELFRDVPMRLGAQEPWICTLVGFALVGSIDQIADQRIRWHQEHSLLSSLALSWPNAAVYRITAILPVAPVIIWLVAGLWTLQMPASAMSLLAGCFLAPILLPFARRILRFLGVMVLSRKRPGLPGRGAKLPAASRSTRIRDQLAGSIFLRRLNFRSSLIFMTLLGLAFGSTYALLVQPQLSKAAAIAILGAATAVCLLRISSQDASFIRYLRQIGVHPRGTILAQLLVGGAFVAALLAGCAIGMSYRPELFLTVLACLAGFAWLTTMRALHYATKTRLAADGAFQFDLLGLIFLGLSFAPAVILLVPGRILMLGRSASSNLWKLP